MGRNVVVELAEVAERAGEEPPAAEAAPRGDRHEGRRDGRPAASGEPRAAEAVNDVRRLFQTAQQPPRWPMYVRQAKQFMRTVDATFDERKFGFNSIVDLLRACQREGLFRIERDRQGVMRLFQGNVMQPAPEIASAEPVVPGAPRPWQPGDDIPDIHEADRPVETSADVVDGDVVREVETRDVLDAQPAVEEAPQAEQPQQAEEETHKKRTRATRARGAAREPRAAKAPRARKTGAARAPRTAKSRKPAE
jgi:hypothetical protein